MEGGVRSMPGDIHESVEPQEMTAAANSTSGSRKQVRKNSWEAGRGEGVDTGGGSVGLGGYEGEPLLREEVKVLPQDRMPKGQVD